MVLVQGGGCITADVAQSAIKHKLSNSDDFGPCIEIEPVIVPQKDTNMRKGKTVTKVGHR